MKLLSMMMDGFCTTAEVYKAPRRYPSLDRNGFASDAKRLVGDVQAVGRDVNKALSKVREKNQNGTTDTRSGAVTQW